MDYIFHFKYLHIKKEHHLVYYCKLNSVWWLNEENGKILRKNISFLVFRIVLKYLYLSVRMIMLIVYIYNKFRYYRIWKKSTTSSCHSVAFLHSSNTTITLGLKCLIDILELIIQYWENAINFIPTLLLH